MLCGDKLSPADVSGQGPLVTRRPRREKGHYSFLKNISHTFLGFHKFSPYLCKYSLKKNSGNRALFPSCHLRTIAEFALIYAPFQNETQLSWHCKFANIQRICICNCYQQNDICSFKGEFRGLKDLFKYPS